MLDNLCKFGAITKECLQPLSSLNSNGYFEKNLLLERSWSIIRKIELGQSEISYQAKKLILVGVAKTGGKD
jgi:hypothetical protein